MTKGLRDLHRVDELKNFATNIFLKLVSKPDYYEFKPWDRSSRLILDYPSSLQNWKPNFFFVSGNGWEFVPSEDLDEAPKFFCSWGTPVSGASFSSVLSVVYLLFMCDDDM